MNSSLKIMEHIMATPASSEMTSNRGCFFTTAAMASSSSFRKTFPKGAEGVLNIKILWPELAEVESGLATC